MFTYFDGKLNAKYTYQESKLLFLRLKEKTEQF